MELNDFKIGQRVKCETDNNGPVLHGVVEKLLPEFDMVRVSLDDGDLVPLTPRDLQPD